MTRERARPSPGLSKRRHSAPGWIRPGPGNIAARKLLQRFWDPNNRPNFAIEVSAKHRFLMALEQSWNIFWQGVDLAWFGANVGTSLAAVQYGARKLGYALPSFTDTSLIEYGTPGRDRVKRRKSDLGPELPANDPGRALEPYRPIAGIPDINSGVLGLPGDLPDNTAVISNPMTSFPNTVPCIDLGYVTVAGHKQKFRHIPKQYVGPKKVIGWSLTGTIDNNAGGSVRFRKGWKPVGTTAWPDAFNGTVTQFGVGFNDVGTLEHIRNTAGLMKSGVNLPVYGTQGIGVTDLNGAKKALILSKQFLELSIKNFSHYSVAGTGTDSACMKVKLYLMQCMDDVHRLHAASTDPLKSDGITLNLREGFDRTYDDVGGTTLSASLTQPYYVTASDNDFINNHNKVVWTKEFCLCPAQEATIKFVLNHPQYQNFEYLTRAKAYGNGLTDYAAVTAKKGEYWFLVRCHGAHLGRSSTSPATDLIGMTPEKVFAAFHATKRTEFHEVLKSETVPLFHAADNTSGVGIAGNEIDIEDVY